MYLFVCQPFFSASGQYRQHSLGGETIASNLPHKQINTSIVEVTSPVLQVFRRFLSQFSTDFHEILQGLLSGPPPNSMKFS